MRAWGDATAAPLGRGDEPFAVEDLQRSAQRFAAHLEAIAQESLRGQLLAPFTALEFAAEDLDHLAYQRRALGNISHALASHEVIASVALQSSYRAATVRERSHSSPLGDQHPAP